MLSLCHKYAKTAQSYQKLFILSVLKLRMPTQTAPLPSIFRQLFWLLFAPLMALSLILSFRVWKGVQTLQFAQSIEEQVQELKIADRWIHGLQQERGLSGAWLGIGSPTFQAALAEIRASNDALRQEFSPQSSWEWWSFSEQMDLRARVDNQSIAFDDVLSAYTTPIRKLLAEDIVITVKKASPEFFQLTLSYQQLRKLKEEAGRERALLVGSFARGHFMPGQFRNWREAYDAQQKRAQIFFELAPADVQAAWLTLQQSEAWERMEQQRSLFARSTPLDLIASDPETGWQTATARVNQIHELEIQLLERITQLARQSAETARRNMALEFLLLLVLFPLIGWISYRRSRQLGVPIRSMSEHLEQFLAHAPQDDARALHAELEQLRLQDIPVNSHETQQLQTFLLLWKAQLQHSAHQIAKHAQELEVSLEELSTTHQMLENTHQRAEHLAQELQQNIQFAERVRLLTLTANWRINLTDRAFSYSDEMYTLLHVPPETELTLESFLKNFQTPDRLKWEALLTPEQLPSYSFEFDSLLQLSTGPKRWMRTKGYVHTNRDGKHAEVFGALTDVTERRLAEEDERFALLQRLELSLQAARCGTWQWDPENGNFYADALCHELNRSPHKLRSIDQLLQCVHPRDRPQVNGLLAQVQKMGQALSVLFRVPGDSAENDTRWLERHVWVQPREQQPPTLIGLDFDVTDRKIAEDLKIEALQQAANEQQLQLLLSITQALQVGALRVDVEKQSVLWFSPSVPTLLELNSSAEAQLQNWADFRQNHVHSEDAHVHQQIAEKLQRHTPYSFRYRIRSPQEAQRMLWIHEVGTPESTHYQAQYLIALQNVTEEAEQEQFWRKQTMLVQRQAEIASLGNWYLPTGHTQIQSDAQTLRHWNLAQPRPMQLEDWLQHIVHQDDQARVRKVFARHMASQAGPMNFSLNYRTQHQRLLRLGADVHTDQYDLFVVEQDITALKRQEELSDAARERLELATQVAEIGVWQLHLNRNAFLLDKRCQETSGLGGVTPWSTWWEHVHPDDRKQVTRKIAVLSRRNRPIRLLYRFIRETEARPRWFEISARWQEKTEFQGLRFEGASYLGVMRDVTELIEQREKLQQALQDAHQAARAKARFLATVTHELRTPLNTVLHFTRELTKKLAPGSPEKITAQRSHEVAEELLALINNVLDQTRLEQGAYELRPQEVELRDIEQRVRSLLQAQAHKKGLQLQVSLPVATLHADPMALLQILLNLAGNALKFTHAGKVLVHGELHPADEQLHQLVLVVKDTGIGIKPEDQQRVFQDFAQADQDEPLLYVGSGLGLATVKGLVDLHQGEIALQSEVGVGTSFTVTLPVKVLAVETTSGEQAESEEALILEPVVASALLQELEEILLPVFADGIPDQRKGALLLAQLEPLAERYNVSWLTHWLAQLREKHDGHLVGSFFSTLKQFEGHQNLLRRQAGRSVETPP